jgi:hypothetical protein
MVPYLGTVLREASRGVWSSMWSAQRAQITGKLERRWLSVREVVSR